MLRLLAEVALKRRRAFPSRQAAMQSYAPRLPFSRFRPSVVRDYVCRGFHRDADSGALRIKTPPEIESQTYILVQSIRIQSPHKVQCPVWIGYGKFALEVEHQHLHPHFFALAENLLDARLVP